MTNIVRERSNLASNVTVIKRQTVRADHTPTIEQKRVAAYCRVSTDLEAQQSSIDLQMSSYKRIIEEHPGWVLAGIYADDGETGTSVENRPEFQRMYADAMAGCFDILLVKSVSRFARNTKDSLEYTRELKAHGVSVYFEKEGLDTSGFTSEFLLTIFAAFAQEESRSISENVKRGIRNRYKLGKPMWRPTYGFRKGYVIYEPEAEVVREIFQLYNQDISAEEIAQILNEKKAPLYPGSKKWVKGMVTRLVSNEKYIGDVLMQKTYCADFMTHKSVSNSDSKIERYYKEGNHDPIVSKEVFYKAGRLKGMGLCNLRHLDEEIGKRKKVVERYRERLEGVEGIKLSAIQKDVESNYAYFPVVFDGYKYTRNEVFEKLAEVGIGARKYFYPLTNSFECYRNYPTAGTEKTPVAQHMALRVLTLPLYADLSLEDVDRICDVILG